MKNSQKLKILICFLLVFSFLLPYFQIASQYSNTPTAEAFVLVPPDLLQVQGEHPELGTDVISWIGEKAVLGPILFISNLIGRLTGSVLWLFGFLINHALGMSDKVTTLPAVTIGWRIARDLVNLFFVLVIIIISLATILRIEQYGAKKLLANLIIAALLINFSLLFAQVFIDFANMLSDFFMKPMDVGSIGSAITLGNTLAGAFQPQNFFEIKTIEEGFDWEGIMEGTGKILQAILSLAFVVAFSLLMVFCLALLTIMLYIRVVALAFLLVLAPAALLCWVVPLAAENWKKWWSEFIRWCFFAPISLFFIYLAIETMKQKESFNIGAINPIEEVEGLVALSREQQAAGIIIKDLPNLATEMMIIVGLIIGGIIIANSLSIGAGKGSFAIGGKVSGWLKGQGKARVIAPTAGRVFEKMQGAGAKSESKFVRAITMPIRKVGKLASDKGLTPKAIFSAQANEQAKKIKDKPIESLSYARYNQAGRLAVLQEALKQGKLGELPSFAQAEVETLYKKAGYDSKEIYAAMPTWKPEIHQALREGDFKNVSQLLGKLLSSLKKWDKTEFSPLFKGSPSVKPANISKEEWQKEFLPWLGESIRADKKAGSKIGKAFSNLNSEGISELARIIKHKEILVLSPEQFKKENASLYHYFTGTPARKADIDIQKTKEDIEKSKKS